MRIVPSPKKEELKKRVTIDEFNVIAMMQEDTMEYALEIFCPRRRCKNLHIILKCGGIKT
jgi:hypothetical protein